MLMDQHVGKKPKTFGIAELDLANYVFSTADQPIDLPLQKTKASTRLSVWNPIWRRLMAQMVVRAKFLKNVRNVSKDTDQLSTGSTEDPTVFVDSPGRVFASPPVLT